LEAAMEAREEGLVRFIGVTGHGLSVPEMHRRSLERFAFDSVLLPYNYVQMQDPRYAERFEALAAVCAQRNVALQTIKSLAWRPSNPTALRPPSGAGPHGAGPRRPAAAWVTHAPVGCPVMPARWTRRWSSSITNGTYRRVSPTVSTVRKSQARVPAACARRNCV